MSDKKVDLYALPLEQLKELAMEDDAKAQEKAVEEAKKAQPQEDAAAQARVQDDPSQRDEIDNSDEADDDQKEGAKSEAKGEQNDGEPDEYVVRTEIDLGDGSGVQVFTGNGETELEAYKDLNAKLATAQKNASKKIRDQEKLIKAQPVKPKAKEFTPAEELIYTQEFQTKPTEAFKKMFKDIFNQSVEDAQLTLSEAKQVVTERRSLAIQQSFVNTHPDYIGNESNGNRIRSWVQAHGYSEFTEDNLEKAYQDLTKSGLLQLKAAEADDATGTEDKEQKRIASTGSEVAQQRSSKKGSTIKAGSRTAPAAKTGPTKDELYSMPLEKLRDLADSQPAQE
jgi:hypothetical protein